MTKTVSFHLGQPVQTHKTTIVESRLEIIQTGEHPTDFTHLEKIRLSGEAHKENGDKFDSDIGVYYASARALEAAARRLRKRADGLVKNAETVKQHKKSLRETVVTPPPPLKKSVKGVKKAKKVKKVAPKKKSGKS